MKSQIYPVLVGSDGRRGLTLDSAAFYVGAVLILVGLSVPQLRHLSYIPALFIPIALIASGGGRYIRGLLPFYFYFIGTFAILPLANKQGVLDAFFLFAGLSLLLLKNIPDISPRKLLLFVIFGYLIWLLIAKLDTGFRFSLTESTSFFESPFSFVFGACAVYFLAVGDKRYYIYSFVLTFLSFKRIAMLGLIAASLVYLAYRWRGIRLDRAWVLILLNMLVLVALVAYGSGLLDYYIHAITGQSSNQLGMGRRVLLQGVSNEILLNPMNFILIGEGPGALYSTVPVSNLYAGIKINAHSDLLKIFYEYGFVFFVGLIFMFYRGKWRREKLIYVYFNVLLFTDNTLIYTFVVFAVAYFARKLTYDGRGAAGGAVGL